MALLSPRSLFPLSRSPFGSQSTPLLVFHAPQQSGSNIQNEAKSLQQSSSNLVDCPPGLAFFPYVIPCEFKPQDTTTQAPSNEYVHYNAVYHYKPPAPSPAIVKEPPVPAKTPKPCKIYHHIFIYHNLKAKPPATTTPIPETTEKPCSTSHKIIKYIYFPQVPSPEPVTTPMTEGTPAPEIAYGSNYYSNSYNDHGNFEDMLSKLSQGDRRK